MIDVYRAASDLVITADGHIAENPADAYRQILSRRDDLRSFPDMAATTSLRNMVRKQQAWWNCISHTIIYNGG